MISACTTPTLSLAFVMSIHRRKQLITMTASHLPFDMLSLEQKKELVRQMKHRNADNNYHRRKTEKASTHNFALELAKLGNEVLAQRDAEASKQMSEVSKERLSILHATLKGSDSMSGVDHQEQNSDIDSQETDHGEIDSSAHNESNDFGGDVCAPFNVEMQQSDLQVASHQSIQKGHDSSAPATNLPDFQLCRYQLCDNHCPRSLTQESVALIHELLKAAFPDTASTNGLGEALQMTKGKIPSVLQAELDELRNKVYNDGIKRGRDISSHESTFTDLPSQAKFVEGVNRCTDLLIDIINNTPGCQVRAVCDNSQQPVRCVCPPLKTADVALTATEAALAAAEAEIDRLREMNKFLLTRMDPDTARQQIYTFNKQYQAKRTSDGTRQVADGTDTK
jgi:hypothetical protein